MVEHCDESGRMLIYRWELKSVPDKGTVMTEMAEFMGLKAFRFGLKRDGRHSKTVFKFLSTNLHKMGFEVAKVLIDIRDKPQLDQMKPSHTELRHFQVFTAECEFPLHHQEVVITFGIRVVGIVSDYTFQLSDVLFSNHLWEAVKSRQWTDIEFAVKGDVKSCTFSAHRAILAARSPVFHNLLQSITSTTIKIDRTEPKAFKIFLRFLYTGQFQLDKQKEINQQVLKLAEQYELAVLTSLCKLALEDIDGRECTALISTFRPNFEVSRPKQHSKKTKTQLFCKKPCSVVECLWRLENIPDADNMLISDVCFFRKDGAFRAVLVDNPVTDDSTLLSPQHYLYLAASHLDKTGTQIYRVDSYIDGGDYCLMDRKNVEDSIIFGRELYGLESPCCFKFEIMIREAIDNYCYTLFDSLRSVHYWSMFELGIETDIEFVFDDDTFRAHRVIVAARSPVLAANFSSGTESVTGRLRIDCIDPDVFREFLYFLYTGTLRVSANSTALLKIAKRYQVQTLICLCQSGVQDLDLEEMFASLLVL